MRHGYPIILDVEDRTCVVVGGGRVAARKVQALLREGARPIVISPQVTPAITALATEGRLELRERPFQPTDLDGALLALVATDDPEANRTAAAAARERGVLVNVADVPALCDFTVPATVHRGAVTIAISTGGASPALARHLRQRLEEAVGEEYGVLAELLASLRAEAQEVIPAAERRAAWQRALAGEALALIHAGNHEGALRALRAALGLPSE